MVAEPSTTKQGYAELMASQRCTLRRGEELFESPSGEAGEQEKGGEHGENESFCFFGMREDVNELGIAHMSHPGALLTCCPQMVRLNPDGHAPTSKGLFLKRRDVLILSGSGNALC